MKTNKKVKNIIFILFLILTNHTKAQAQPINTYNNSSQDDHKYKILDNVYLNSIKEELLSIKDDLINIQEEINPGIKTLFKSLKSESIYIGSSTILGGGSSLLIFSTIFGFNNIKNSKSGTIITIISTITSIIITYIGLKKLIQKILKSKENIILKKNILLNGSLDIDQAISNINYTIRRIDEYLITIDLFQN